MFSYIVDLYNRAMSNQKLTPHERAALKAVQGAIIGFVTSLVPQLVEVYVAHGSFNWSMQAVNTLLVAFALALFKLWAAQSDSNIGDVIDAYSKQLQQQGLKEFTTPANHIPAVHLIIPSAGAVASTVMVPQKNVQEPNDPDTTKPMPKVTDPKAQPPKSVSASVVALPDTPVAQPAGSQ